MLIVAPLVGARIEIRLIWMKSLTLLVAPLVGARIEIRACQLNLVSSSSLPSWERGLKLQPLLVGLNPNLVAPLVGARIEIAVRTLSPLCSSGRSPRGSED